MTKITTDPNDPLLKETGEDGQKLAYLVLPDQKKGVRFEGIVRHTYKHLKCGTKTTIGQKIAETYARNPKFYSHTFCCECKEHYPLKDEKGENSFFWLDGSPVGE